MDSGDLIILTKLDLIYNHLILKDAHDAGLIPDDMWIQLLKNQMSIMMEVKDEKGSV